MSRMSGMRAEATWDPGAAGSTVVATTITVPGAKLGDFAFASHDGMSDANADDLVMTALVSSANTVTVSIFGDAQAPNVASGTLRVKVVPYDVI